MNAMNDVYTFINEGLVAYISLQVDDFSQDVFSLCQDLNCLLNKNVNSDYAKHLKNNSTDIKNKIWALFDCLSKNLYVNMYILFDLLSLYQENTRIDNDKYRDHYYHSVQCFLLGLSLCALHPVLINKFNTERGVYPNITTIFFMLFLYHDLGYLYNTKDADRINETIRTWLLDVDLESRIVVERIRTIFELRDLPEEIIAEFARNEDLNSIWKQPVNETDRLLLKDHFSISRTPCDVEKHHSYDSAAVLYRFVRTKDLLSGLSLGGLSEGTLCPEIDKRKEQFFEVIKSILFHDFNIQSELLLENEFLACLLMLADEIQNYGRSYQDEKYNNKIILPTKVGLEITSNNKLNLVLDENFVNMLDAETQKSYRNYTTNYVYDVLSNKIDSSDLDLIFERNEK